MSDSMCKVSNNSFNETKSFLMDKVHLNENGKKSQILHITVTCIHATYNISFSFEKNLYGVMLVSDDSLL